MEENNKDKILYISVDDIIPNRFQPRLAFNENELNELASSISKYGVIQPIILRNIGNKYEIIAGERRYKASCLAGLKKVPAIINNTDDNTSAEIALLENLQRKNLTPIEEAQSYKKLMNRGFTQEEIANKLGISQSAIANKLRLLNLPKKVQNALLYNKISERHARSLLTLNDEELQISLLDRIINERLTVKQTEEEIDILLNKTKNANDIPIEIQKYISGDRVDNIEKDKQDISKSPYESEELEKLLESKNSNEQKTNSYVFKIPDVVNIDDNFNTTKEFDRDNNLLIKENKDFENDINPFQRDINTNMNNNVYDRLSQNFKNDILEDNDNVTDNPIIKEKEEIKEQSSEYINDNNQTNIPKIIGLIRDCLGEIKGSSKIISTEEKDLSDKYQIIIEIDKNISE
ncbi:MAG: ParB/RepB/Spo0J family partition protein [bacterium]|nr:ParB/RepB/Spo0J family partition protein [bacterium]